MRKFCRAFVIGCAVCLSYVAAADACRAAAEAPAHGKEAAETAEPHQEGVPLQFKADLAMWSGITFVIFIFLLGRFAWKPLIALLAEGRRDAERAKQEIVTEAQKEAEAAKQRAVHEIGRARDAALKDLFDVMATEVAHATEHVLGRSLTGADQDRLIDEALAQFPRG